ncbi:MAG: ABC transporter ATP-binding protein [Chloroflexia bacterium]|nr:ABC transporter ATP-binding protein [Chloroflexia bacterium]
MATRETTRNGATASPNGTATEDAQPIIDVRGLTKHFPVGGFVSKQVVHALEDVSFSIPRGEVVALVGESGSGKSTTARLLARLMPPTSGEIVYEGNDILKTEPRGAPLSYRSDVQMVFQDPFGSLNPVHPIRYHLERPLKIHKKTRGRRELRERMHELLETVGLQPPDEVAAKYPYQLSGGQRQRVAFARALAVEPRVMLADEPVSMLDVSIRIGILNLIDRLREEQGISFLYITHDIASARYIADQTNVMYAGRMVEGAESTELIAEPAHPYTKLLLSAVPNPHAGLRTEEAPRGEIPSLIDPPPGCPFEPRCPYAMDVCRREMPGISQLGRGHWVRCHLYPEGEAATGMVGKLTNESVQVQARN